MNTAYTRMHIACKQLETSITLLISSSDFFSAITLAGAADSIFIELVRRIGKRDFASSIQEILQQEGKNAPTLNAIRSDMNYLLGINSIKHFDQKDLDHIKINAEECAVASILKAMANLQLIQPNHPSYIKEMLLWCEKNLEGDQALSRFKNLTKYINNLN
jgi:hypothetical protein